MAAYKIPRVVEFAETLPKSATGKVQWRVLQEKELQRPLESTQALTVHGTTTLKYWPKHLPKQLTSAEYDALVQPRGSRHPLP